MANYANVVRFHVKRGKQSEFEDASSRAEPWDRQFMYVFEKTGQQSLVVCGLWKIEEKMPGARSQIFGLLDNTRPLLCEQSSELC